MSETAWILFALAGWFVLMSLLWMCGKVVKDVDRAQSDVIAAGRRARFIDPPRRTEVG